MAEIMRFHASVIMTIPGIAYINGGIILGEIGDIHRFSTPSKLLAFAGLDPSIYQSGNFQARRTRMSKRGSRVLRYALVNATHNVVKNNATFKAYYDKKVAEGRTHYNAQGHCAGKLVSANVNHFFTLLGKMFFTPYGKEFFTYPGKQIFTS